LGEESKRKQKRKPLALARKLYEDNFLRIREILATKVDLTLALTSLIKRDKHHA